jgi:hypothetical protein
MYMACTVCFASQPLGLFYLDSHPSTDKECHKSLYRRERHGDEVPHSLVSPPLSIDARDTFVASTAVVTSR